METKRGVLALDDADAVQEELTEKVLRRSKAIEGCLLLDGFPRVLVLSYEDSLLADKSRRQ